MTSPDEPLDERDHAILAGVGELWRRFDPMPDDLLARVKFAIELDTTDVEVMQATEAREPAAVRVDERPRLITFDSESVTIMRWPDDGVRHPPASVGAGARCAVVVRCRADRRAQRRRDPGVHGRFALQRNQNSIVQCGLGG